MGNIGDDTREIEFVPVPETNPEPIKEPVKEPEPVREPEKVPA